MTRNAVMLALLLALAPALAAVAQPPAGLSGRVEWVEEVAKFLGLDTGAIVANLNYGRVDVGLTLDFDFNLPAAAEGLQGVLTQCPQGHVELCRIGLEKDRLRISDPT